jgi:hypothetical protein
MEEVKPAPGFSRSLSGAREHGGAEIKGRQSCFWMVVAKVPSRADPGLEDMPAKVSHQAGPPFPVPTFPRKVENVVKPRCKIVLLEVSPVLLKKTHACLASL